jgi:hypothetical protein
VIAYLSLHIPKLEDGVTRIITSLTLGNLLYYYFDEENSKTFPLNSFILGGFMILFSLVNLFATFSIMKFVSSNKFNCAGSFFTGSFSLRVDNLPKDLNTVSEVLILKNFLQ